jgi:hypothetical protein
MIMDSMGVDALADDPNGVLLSQEIADFEVGAGDTFQVTLYPDDLDLSQKAFAPRTRDLSRDSAHRSPERDG